MIFSRGCFLMLITLFAACVKNDDHVSENGIDHVIDFALSGRYHQPIELRGLYDSLVHVLPADSVEKSIIATSLKNRGFEVVNWGRGNYPPCGVRMITTTLKKDQCICNISKIYYATIAEDLFEIHEVISCNQIAKK